MNISQALAQIFPSADPLTAWRVEDDGNGPQLTGWNLPDPQPTSEQIAAAWDVVAARQAAAEALAMARGQMAAMFDGLTTEQQAAFGLARIAVETALDAGRVEVAREIVKQTQVPEDLEPIKAQMLALFPQ